MFPDRYVDRLTCHHFKPTNKPGGQLSSYTLRKEDSSRFHPITGGVGWCVEPALQANSETDRRLNSHFTSCCQRPVCELWVRENLQQRKRKQRPPKILHCWLLWPDTVKTDLVWNKTGGPPKRQTGMIPQTHPDTTPKPYPPTAAAKSRKLPRRGSLRSNQVAFNLYFTICCCWIVQWRVWRVEERAVWPKHTMVTQPGERVATRFERCQKAAS